MWVITTQGFYSAVAHRDEPDQVIVRARTRDDIEALRRQIPDIEPFEDATADYRHRVVVGRAEWVAAVAQLASAIDYDNFKDEVAAVQAARRVHGGDGRCHVPAPRSTRRSGACCGAARAVSPQLTARTCRDRRSSRSS